MRVELALSDEDDAYIVKNLWPLYLQDISEFEASRPNRHGLLIEGDDGGVYRRTNPRSNDGDWFSMNGDIQTTEFHAVGPITLP